MKIAFSVAIFLTFVCLCFAGSASQWKTRTIYQVLTDRYARTDGSTNPCNNLGNYCGGTFLGIINKLDYIVGMGFDAIWISPVITNTPGGYHGYWAQDMDTINSNFGSSSDLMSLVSHCHARGIWVMLDVVANHVGPVGYTYNTIVPFNQAVHYHNCDGCDSNCDISDWNNQAQVEHCRLAGLPDLNQTNTYVRQTLLQWIKNIVSNYGFDGLRVDTVPEVAKDFWVSYSSSAGVYAVGEVFNGDVGYVASYQGPLDALLSYPMYFTLRSVFGQQQSMYQIQSQFQTYHNTFKDPTILGTFLDNHDNPRFLNEQKDHALYKGGLTYVLMSEGIPIVYYGSEQGFSGGNDPNCREALWTSNYNTKSDLYTYITEVVGIRKKYGIATLPQVQRYADDRFYAFTRGTVFVALTNGGSGQSQIVRTISYHPYSEGTKLCNLLFTGDCVVVQGGKFDVYLNNGEAKIFVPQ